MTERAARIRLLVFDVDGVLTDGGMYYGEHGEALLTTESKDCCVTVTHRDSKETHQVVGKSKFKIGSAVAWAVDGTTVCVGAPPLEEGVSIPNVVVFASQEKKLCGCLLGSCNAPRDIPRLVGLWRAGLLDLEGMITHRRPLEEINEGFADMAAGRGIRTVIDF